MSVAKRVGVLMGGVSAERDLSIRAGEAVVAALSQAGHTAIPLFVDRDVDLALRQADIEVAFLCLRGRYAGDGCLQGLLELVGIPYTGSGVLASGLAMNRAKTKDVLRLHNLPTAPGYVLRVDTPDAVAEAHAAFGFPAVVRPVGVALPLGPTVAEDELELEAALEDAFRMDDEVLVERHIPGRRICVAVIDGLALGGVEVRAPRGERAAALPRISPPRYRSLLRVAAAAYEALGCEGAACVELLLSDRLNEVVVEVDTNPIPSPAGTLARIAQGAGTSYDSLIAEILEGARVRAHGHRQNRRAMQLSFDGPERRQGSASPAH
jgi:D-alanine-D-alanine ligase